MVNRGLQIEVSKEEFLSKPDKEQHWMLYEAIHRINGHGCHYGRSRWKKLFVWVTSVGLVGGFFGGIARRIWQ